MVNEEANHINEDGSADTNSLTELLQVSFKKLTNSTDIILEESFQPSEKIDRADFETAIECAGYGRFQGLLLCVCGAIYATCAMSTITVSFVLPSAECDFNLSSSDKGKLSATPLIGMCVGTYLWGNLADARGRKWMIISSLLVDALAGGLSSLAKSFPIFLACRFFSGFGIIGATSLLFPYFGDFLSVRNRDVMLCRLEVFWTLGTILLPAIAWSIIPEPWSDVSIAAPFSYSSWRIFVAVCAAPSLIVAALVSFFPESPRYLLASGHVDMSMNVLRTIYHWNKRQPPENYPVLSLTLGDDDTVAVDKSKLNLSIRQSVRIKWDKFWVRKKTLTARPYIGYLILCCFVDFGLMFSYYTLMMWFPDLFERFGQFSALHPNKSAGVCEVASIVLEESELDSLFEKCERPIDSRVFLYTLLVGMSCLPTSISVGLLINKLGKKPLLSFMLISSGLAAVGLNFVHSSGQNLILSCIFEAIISCTEAVLFCVIVEIFPTNVAGSAMSVTVLLGRVGAIVGNVTFGALVDYNCIIPIYLFGILLCSSGLLVFALPKRDKPTLQG